MTRTGNSHYRIVRGSAPARIGGRSLPAVAKLRFAAGFACCWSAASMVLALPVGRTVEPLAALQCVPYARQLSGIRLYGDARTWWTQAAGRYPRGHLPAVGAVMAFAPYGKMRLGHVAVVSRVIDSRRILLRHANWSPIAGQRGQVETDVLASDVSPANDWSAVRVWFAPLGGLGTTHWPVSGFIYPGAISWTALEAPRRPRRDPIGEIIAAYRRADAGALDFAEPGTRPPARAREARLVRHP